MLDIGWTELLVIGIVALIVVGPKDLPLLFRRLGEFTGKARAMAREFSSAMDRAADEAGVRDVQKNLRDVANPKKMGLDAFKSATDDLTAWDPDKAAGKGADKTAARQAEAAAGDMKAAETPATPTGKGADAPDAAQAQTGDEAPEPAPRDEKTA